MSSQETDREFLDPGVLDELGNMNVVARTLVDGILAGLHRSPHRGGSVEFAEYTEYTPGDEIRHIDWKVYAKTDKYYVKEYEDETNLRAYLMLDSSGSMDFASADAPLSKMRYAAYLAATFGYLLLRQGDGVGGMSFEETTGEFLPASTKKSHLEDVFYLLENLGGEGETGYEEAFRTVSERAPRRSMILVFSDFLGVDQEAMDLLKVLKEQGRDVAVFHTVDPAELTLPYEGLRIFEGMEGEGELLADPDDLREAYVERMRQHLDFVEQSCRESDIGYYRFSTRQPIEQICLDFLRARL